ncbi:MAG TPA: hypothetical protein VE338_21345 [Ktedonobacterales bacterium]|nr:hypothetical protein [Ktedonobacterales bacterium]
MQDDLQDDEHPEGVRITLERDGHTPFAIPCGIYGWFMHARFFSAETEAQQASEDMKRELVRVATLIPRADDPHAEDTLDVVYEAFSAFTHEFP